MTTRLRRLLGLALFAALLPAAAASAAPRELNVAMLRTAADGQAPANGERSESGAVAELNDALARELCQRLAVRCNRQLLPFAEIIPGVESGRYQLGVGNVLRTPEREQRVLFSNPLWRSSSRLVGTPAALRRQRAAPGAGNGDELRPQSLRALRVAVQRGTQQHALMLRLAPAQELTLVETSTSGEAMTALLDGRAEFALLPMRSAYFLIAGLAPGSVEFAGPALTEDGLGGSVHLILPKNEEALRREVDAALDAMRADGTFQRIVRRHMPFLAD